MGKKKELSELEMITHARMPNVLVAKVKYIITRTLQIS